MSTFKHLTYEEWIEQNPEVLLQEVECRECRGTGTDECPHCGGDMECEECDGSGKVNDARKQYEEQIQLDEEQMEKYLAKVATVMLPDGSPRVKYFVS